MVEILVCVTVSCIETTISDHFKMLFRDMLDQTFDEVYYRNGFLNILVIFMPVVMKSDGLGIFVIMVDPGGGNDWSSEITPDIFCYNFWVTFVWFGIDVKPSL